MTELEFNLGNQQGDKQGAPNHAERQIDLVAMCLRHAWLLATCLVITSVLGGIYYLTAPSTYASTSEILVETRHSPVFDENASSEATASAIETHASLVSSSMILEKAIERGNLEQLGIFDDALGDNLAIIRNIKESIVVGVPDDSAPILKIAYSCGDPQDSQQVISSIADSYQAYLGDKSLGLSVEMTELIAKAKDDLLQQLQKMESDYATFRSSAPVLWKEGTAVNIHRERQVGLEQKRKELLVEKHMLAAKVSSLIDSIAAGGEAWNAANMIALAELDSMRVGNQIAASQSVYSQQMTDSIVTLMVTEEELSSQFGDGHPELEAVRNRLSSLRKALKSTLNGETNSKEVVSVTDNNDAKLYLRILQEKSKSLKDQLQRLDVAFSDEEADANRVQSFLSRDQAYRTEINRTQQLFDAVVARLDEINIIQNYSGDRISIIEPAQQGRKCNPTLAKTAALSLLSGLLLGSLLAYRLELKDSSFSNPAEIRKAVGAPILAEVPRFPLGDASPIAGAISESVLAYHGAESQAAEVFRGIRTALYFSSARQNMKVLQVTSPLPGDGKSTMISNLAVTIAQSGRKVVLVDADCRRPTIHKVFGLEQGPGLVDLVNGNCELDDVLVETDVENLYVIRSGKPPKNPSELLSSERFDDVLTILGNRFDQVLIDTPPVLAVSDGCAVAAKVDGVVLVLRLTGRSQDVTSRARRVLESVEANVIGVVVNAVEKNSMSGGYGSYGYGYGGYSYGTYGSEGKEYFANAPQAEISGPKQATHALNGPKQRKSKRRDQEVTTSI